MFTRTPQNNTSAVASEGRCLKPAHSTNEVILFEEEHVVHPVTVTTSLFWAQVRRSSVMELIAIVTIIIINSKLRRRRDWRDWEMLNRFRGGVLELLTCPHTLLLSARLTIVTTLS